MTHTLQAIAWTLIHFCWQATALAAFYRIINLAVAHRSSHVRYLVALAALLLMMAASVATLTWELRSSVPSPSSAVNTSIAPGAVSESTSSSTSIARDLPHTMEPGRLAARLAPSGFSLASVLWWVDGVWVAGVLALSLRSLGGFWLIQRLRTSAQTLPPPQVHASFLRICAVLRLRRSVLLRVSTAIAGPVTVGAVRAMVLLPLSAISSLGPEELEVVFAHELAHVRRADFLWNVIQTLAETLFFFHPAVWWINGCIRHERELCCDDLALKICPNPVVYAGALFRLEEQRSRHLRLAMALDGHQGPQTLRMRIARILGDPAESSPSRSARPLSLAAACAALIIFLLPVPQLLARLSPMPKAASIEKTVSKPLPKPAAAHPIPANTSVRLAAPMQPVIMVSGSPQQELGKTAASAYNTQDGPQPKLEDKASEAQQHKSTYIDAMKAAGYDVDLDKYISMKIQDITPEYARAMSQVGFGKLSADDLISCKIQGVTQEYIAQLKQQGLEVKSVHDAISYRIFSVTPEFVAGMKAAGFDGLTSKQLLSLRVQGVTPEYARSITQQFPGATADDLVKTRIFNIDAAFIDSAKKHGFTNPSLEKLVRLRISGVLEEEK
jgi:beta-lactamase regulating signal transducer with metallopeptidase domain